MSKQYFCADYLIQQGCNIDAPINENLDLALLAYTKNMQEILHYLIKNNSKSQIFQQVVGVSL